MSIELEQLVSEAIELTGAAPPELLHDDAPVLVDAAPRADELYLVGLIGGKDVGKSSLVNAIVGKEISERSGFGEGTGRVIAYAHESAVESLRELLSREVPDKFRVVAHDVDALSRQVLLDLPDIDSHWTEHVHITRRTLRHMLYPIWVQSVEKYADLQPQKLLQQVAAGNDPANFVFVLNKADQLVAREGAHAATELRDDYARRLARVLKLPNDPRVHLISALDPSAFDLPELRRTLARQRSEDRVGESIELAGRRRQHTLVDWLDSQQLPERAARTQRLLHDAEELVAARVVEPLLDEVVPKIASDPSHRLALIEAATSKRLARWPIVNVIQVTLSPLGALVRRNLARPAPGAAPAGQSNATLVDGYLNDPSTSATLTRTLAGMIRTTFAQLRQLDPEIGEMYASKRLWNDHAADAASVELSRRLATTVTRQREVAVELVARCGAFANLTCAPIRWLLTIGALLWFPIAQPVLERALNGNLTLTLREAAALVVPLLGSAYLLQSVTFLIIWFVALWVVLRWDTHRRVNALLRRWSAGSIDSDLSLPGAVLRWIDELLDPLKRQAEQAAELASRIDSFKRL